MNDMNVVWMVVDTLRADRLGCYGYFRDTSPNIDMLAAGGVLFEDFYCSGISTGSAFTCLFTGLPAVRHRFYCTPPNNPNLMNFDDTIPTLQEIVQSNSDCTMVAVDNLVNFGGHMKQTVRGFEFYVNPTRQAGFPQPEYTAEEVNARFLPWLRHHSDERFFAFIHFWDPHHNPYTAPGYRDRFRQPSGSLEGLPVLEASVGYRYVPGWGRTDDLVWGMSMRSAYPGRQVDGGVGAVHDDEGEHVVSQDLYDCSIAYLDNQIARVLDVLREQGVLDRTLIVLTADHGEGLGNHGVWGHGLLYDDTIHIPLVLWAPGALPAGLRANGFAQHVDVAPTILDLMGISQKESPVRVILGSHERGTPQEKGVEVRMEGRSLLPQVRGRDRGPRYAVTEVRRGPRDPGLRSMTTKKWKLIESLAGALELYDRDADPMEKVNVASEHPSRAADMSRTLHNWIAGHLADGEEDPMRTVYGESDDRHG